MEVPENTQRHTRQTEADRADTIYFVRRKFCFCDVAAEILAQVMVQRQITRSICRISPVVGIGLPVESTLVVSPTYESQHYKQNDVRPAKIRSTRTSAQSDQSLRSAHSG